MSTSGHPVLNGLLGTLFTWAVTAAGAAMVFCVPSSLSHRSEGRMLDFSLGFAAGVMIAASFWSLLAPAIEMAADDGYGRLTFLPAALGFAAGGAFVYAADSLLPEGDFLSREQDLQQTAKQSVHSETPHIEVGTRDMAAGLRQRSVAYRQPVGAEKMDDSEDLKRHQRELKMSWRRIMLLVLAVTLHNAPEGLAVGVGFGAVGTSPSATFEGAVYLAIGIGIQNFPEGLAVALPMRRLGYSKWKCFWYGQLSGMVEPICGVLGAAAVVAARPILPYALAFAAGAMIFVVVDSIIPEAQMRENGRLCSCGTMVGFLVMMSLDVGLG